MGEGGGGDRKKRMEKGGRKKKDRRVTGLSRSIEPRAIIAAFNPAPLRIQPTATIDKYVSNNSSLRGTFRTLPHPKSLRMIPDRWHRKYIERAGKRVRVMAKRRARVHRRNRPREIGSEKGMINQEDQHTITGDDSYFLQFVIHALSHKRSDSLD